MNNKNAGAQELLFPRKTSVTSSRSLSGVCLAVEDGQLHRSALPSTASRHAGRRASLPLLSVVDRDPAKSMPLRLTCSRPWGGSHRAPVRPGCSPELLRGGRVIFHQSHRRADRGLAKGPAEGCRSRGGDKTSDEARWNVGWHNCWFFTWSSERVDTYARLCNVRWILNCYD